MPDADPIRSLERWTVIVCLLLLAIVVVADVYDAVFGRNTFAPDVSFYTLIGGVLVGGVFGAVSWLRRKGGNGD